MPTCCLLCGKPPAYKGALYCGAACCARWEGGQRPTKLTEDQALDILWGNKGSDALRTTFVWATTTEPVTMRVWDGNHPVEEHTVNHVAPTGTTVLVTMASRFGDVGIRDDRLNPPNHGYYARVEPSKLTDWRHIPEDAPKDWAGEEDPPDKLVVKDHGNGLFSLGRP
jgi:hypothetical protein